MYRLWMIVASCVLLPTLAVADDLGAAFRDGKKFVDAKIVEVEFFDKLDKKVFAKP